MNFYQNNSGWSRSSNHQNSGTPRQNQTQPQPDFSRPAAGQTQADIARPENSQPQTGFSQPAGGQPQTGFSHPENGQIPSGFSRPTDGQPQAAPHSQAAKEGRPQSPPPESGGNTGWQNDPSLKNMDLKKLAFLSELVTQSGGKSVDTLLPFLISANQNANSMGLQFTNSETDLILNVLKSRMSPEEQSRIEMFRKMAGMLGKKQ